MIRNFFKAKKTIFLNFDLQTATHYEMMWLTKYINYWIWFIGISRYILLIPTILCSFEVYVSSSFFNCGIVIEHIDFPIPHWNRPQVHRRCQKPFQKLLCYMHTPSQVFCLWALYSVWKLMKWFVTKRKTCERFHWVISNPLHNFFLLVFVVLFWLCLVNTVYIRVWHLKHSSLASWIFLVYFFLLFFRL